MSTWDGFLHHVLRRDYGTFTLFSGAAGRDTEGFLPRTNAYINDVAGPQVRLSSPPDIAPL